VLRDQEARRDKVAEFATLEKNASGGMKEYNGRIAEAKSIAREVEKLSNLGPTISMEQAVAAKAKLENVIHMARTDLNSGDIARLREASRKMNSFITPSSPEEAQVEYRAAAGEQLDAWNRSLEAHELYFQKVKTVLHDKWEELEAERLHERLAESRVQN